jgi:endoglycosylceramidase
VRFRRLVVLLCVVTGLAVATAGVSDASTPGQQSPSAPVSHVGRWIVDASGRVVIDHGFNLVAKQTPYLPSATGFGTDDAQFLASHGFTAVRLGVLLEAIEPAPGTFDDNYLNGIANTVVLLGRYGIRSLIDLHQDLFNERYQGEGLPAWMALDNGLPAQPQAGFPGNYFAMPALWRAFDNLWANAAGPGGVGLRDRVAQAWAHVAARFRGDSNVLGYDLFNEPFPGSDYSSCFPPQGCAGDDQTKLAPFMRASIDAVHRVDPTHLTFYEPWLMFDYGAPTGLGKFADGMSGMSFHDYCLATLGAPETPPTRTTCNQGVEERVMANALNQAKTSGDALLLSEFGATTDQAEYQEMLPLADRNAMPWLEWAYCACGDPTGNRQVESLVYDANKPPTGANVNASNLAALDEPHPQLVAGTPGAFNFDPSSRLFTFQYSTAPVGVRKLQSGLATRIWVGQLHYPHGYAVRVSGGRVTSSAGADWLTVVAASGQHDVSVTVAPLG